jgi:hypothetical protein
VNTGKQLQGDIYWNIAGCKAENVVDPNKSLLCSSLLLLPRPETMPTVGTFVREVEAYYVLAAIILITRRRMTLNGMIILRRPAGIRDQEMNIPETLQSMTPETGVIPGLVWLIWLMWRR